MTAPVTDPADLGVLEASASLRDGSLSPAELLAACERRIAERGGGEPTFDGVPDAVNAWVRLYPEVADRHARAAGKRLAREASSAPLLCGIPLALKDLYAVEGLPLTASSRVLAGHVPDHSSVAWERLRDNGMVLAGHTHTHEFAAGGTADQVGNPWALDRSAGGSSGGSAAALACGMVPAALGTDTLGSLRIPAALCGVSSIKPTHGRVPIGGIIPLAPSLDHAGPMARSVADCSALLNTLAAGGAEPTPLMPPPAPAGALPLRASTGERPLAGVTVAVTGRPQEADVQPDVADGLEQARRACEELGADVVELPAATQPFGPELSTVMCAEAGAYHARHADSRDAYRTSIREFIDVCRDFTAVDEYLRAQHRRAQVTAAWEDWFAEHGVDVLLEPTTPTTAHVRGAGYDSGHLGGETDRLVQLSATWNSTGFPVAALPAGLGQRTGLPVGVSLVAPRGAEQRLVQIGIDLQALALPPLGTVEPRPHAGAVAPEGT